MFTKSYLVNDKSRNEVRYIYEVTLTSQPSMEFVKALNSLDSKGVISILHQCILDAEKCVHQMDLSDIRLTLYGYCLADDKIQVEIRPRILPAHKSDIFRSQTRFVKTESKPFRRVTSDCSLVKYIAKSCDEKLVLPISIKDIDVGLLSSGAAIYPGCKNRDGNLVVLLCCDGELWIKKKETQITHLLFYFYQITREIGLALLVNARNATLENLQTLLAVVDATEAAFCGAISTVHILLDRSKGEQTLSLDFQSGINSKVKMVENLDDVVNKTLLPVEFGGTMVFNQQSWIQYKQKLESLMHDCYTVASYVFMMTDEMLRFDDLPKSIREANLLISQHEEKIKKLMDDELLQRLCSDGNATLMEIYELEKLFSKHEEFCESAEVAQELFQKVENAVMRLEGLVEERRQKLDGCLQLREFEEKANQVINHLCTEGEDLLTIHKNVGDNFRTIKLQQIDFDASYQVVMKFVNKGRDVIDEAGILTQLGVCDELTGIKEICRELKTCITSFTIRLEEAKQTIHNTHKCFQLLDKSFEWALMMMKFIVDLKLQKEMQLIEVEESLKILEEFTSEHPPLSSESIQTMDDLTSSLNNSQLLKQWQKAKVHCIETENLVRQRLETLQQVLDSLKSQNIICRKYGSETMNVSRVFDSSSVLRCENLDRETIVEKRNSSLDNDNNKLDLPIQIVQDDRPDESTSAHMYDINPPLVVDLDIYIPCVSEDFYPVKKDDLDIIIPPTDNKSTKPQRKSNDFSVSSLPRRRSHSGLPLSTSSDYNEEDITTPKSSQPFDVREYMLKECVTSPDFQLNEVPLWHAPHVFSSNELASNAFISKNHLSSSKTVLTFPRNSETNEENVFLPSASVTFRQSVRPRWKRLKKAISMLVEGDLNFKKGLFRKESMELSPTVAQANSTESLPELWDEDPQTETKHSTKEEIALCKYGWSEISSNSHLIYSNRHALSGHCQSLADIRMTEEDIRRNRVLFLIMQELIMTERDYISSLDYIITNYIPELLDEDVIQPLRGKKNVIFGNIEKIHEFHSQIFFSKLEQCQNMPFQLGTFFLQHESEFYLYAIYNKNKPKADNLMVECGSLYFKKKQRELKDKMDLNSYLLKPVQRMGKYALLLLQIVKECPETNPDFVDLQAALEMVKFQLRHGNDLLAMDCLKDCDINLQEQGMLLRQHEFVVYHGRRKCLRQVFLFGELLLFSKIKHSSSGHDSYLYKNSMKTSDIGLTESVGDSGCKFEVWFRKRASNVTYILQASTPDIRQQWVDDISRILWKQTCRNRELRLAEMAFMGMGSKPSLDLKQSKDNIKDRFINIDHSNRNITMRLKSISQSSSHAVNRRPHSIISVSSLSSSSIGSFSSGYGSCFSSGFGAIGMLATTEESPLESSLMPPGKHGNIYSRCPLGSYLELNPEESLFIESNDNTSPDTSKDSVAADEICLTCDKIEASQNKNNDNKLSKVEVEVSQVKGESCPMKEDAFTQTTLKRPQTKSRSNGIAPIASVDSDLDEI